MVSQYKETPGLLMFLLGNENNYGLFCRGAETENIPMEDRKSTQDAYHLYKLFNDAAKEMKAISQNQPVAICNGDLLFLDIIAKLEKDIFSRTKKLSDCPESEITNVAYLLREKMEELEKFKTLKDETN